MGYGYETPKWRSLFTPANETRDESLILQRKYRFAERFQLIQRLGEGGFGQVWRVQDLLLDQKVALKVSLKDLTAETLALRRLPKDRYVSIFDYVSDNSFGAQAYSMELLDPPWMTLEDYQNKFLRRWLTNPAKATDAIRIVINISVDLLTSLRELHGRKYGKHDRWVHGDIKPQNVYINCERSRFSLKYNWDSVRPFTKIGDLGLIRVNRAPFSGYTPDYAPPEHKLGVVSPAVDLFAVGQTMAFLLLGRPFGKEELAHVSRMERTLGEHIPGSYVAKELARSLRKMTKSTPSLRGSVEEAISRLTNIFKLQEEWKILNVFVSRPSTELTLSQAAKIVFEDLKTSNGWKNRTEERNDEIIHWIREMYKRGVLSRIGQRYSLRKLL